jgi:TolB-like protein/Tfp pilus assembly protein PilF
MPGTPSAPGNPNDPPNDERRLESWGEIASYLRRDIRTVQRWEDYGLPVRRLVIGKTGQVYAYPSELDAWVRNRQPAPKNDPAKSDPPAPRQVTPPDPRTTPEPPKPDPRPKSWRWQAAVGGLVILIILGWVGLARDWFPDSVIVSQRKKLLFVRPFASLPPDADQQLFVKGLKDEMVTQLGRVDPEHLGVFAPTTSDAEGFKSISELRSLLHADYVLEGSVRRALGQLRIDVALISTKDGSQVWSKPYTGDAQNILKLQDDVTQDVSTQIRGTLPTSSDNAKRQSVDPRAYEAYLEGRVHWLDRDLARSKESYERALQIDPGYSRARAGLAMVFLVLGQSPNDALRPSQSVPLAREAAQAALQSDPKNSDAYCVLGNIAQSYDHDMPAAEAHFKKALDLDPTNVTAHEWYGYFLSVNRRFPEALRQTSSALEIDPASALLQNVQAEIFYYQREFDASINQELKTLERSPTFLYSRIWLASAYREKKMYKQALEQFDLARKQSNNSPALLGLYAHALAVSGDPSSAKSVLNEMTQVSSSAYVPALYFAAVYTGLGDKDRTFEQLQKAYAEQNDRLVYLAVDPIADSLRNDPRFQDLMKRSGLH